MKFIGRCGDPVRFLNDVRTLTAELDQLLENIGPALRSWRWQEALLSV